MVPLIIELLSVGKGLEMALTPLPDNSPKNPPLKAGLVERQQVPAAPAIAAFSKNTGLVPLKSPAV